MNEKKKYWIATYGTVDHVYGTPVHNNPELISIGGNHTGWESIWKLNVDIFESFNQAFEIAMGQNKDDIANAQEEIDFALRKIDRLKLQLSKYIQENS